MQSNIFAKVAPLLEESKLNIDVDVFIGFLAHYTVGDWIYPAVIHRELGFDLRAIYDALEILQQNDYIEQFLEIYCPSCQRYTGQFFKTIGEVPPEIYCENCDFEITNPLQHAAVVYMVL